MLKGGIWYNDKKTAPCLGWLLSEEDPEENPMPYALLAAALVAVDQLVKYLVLQNIPLGGPVSFIPHLV